MKSRQMTKTMMKIALLQKFTPPKTIFCKLKEWIEWAMKIKKVKLNE